MHKTLLTIGILSALISFGSFQRQTCPEPGKPCTKSGCFADEKEKKLNTAKNRSVTVPDQDPTRIKINMLINRGRRDDRDLFLDNAYVEITDGYLIRQDEQGKERCNCNLASEREKDGDIHMYIGLVPDAPIKNCMVVEITPAWKKKHPEYNIKAMVGKKVKVRGFLLYDYKHTGNAVNTCESCANVWRKTCWEVHPVTEIIPTGGAGLAIP